MEEKKFSIIRGMPDNASALTGISIASKRHWNYPEKWIQLWIPALTVSADYIAGNEVCVAVADDTPVGYYSLKRNGEELWLDNLWVLPGYMGWGIGKALFVHALERSRGYGVRALNIEADPNAAGFYEKMGAYKIGEHHGEMDGQPRILPVMEVNL